MSGIAASSLEGEVTTLAVCWRLRRRDGLMLGFTSHDRDLWLEGLWYRARPGVTPSALVMDDSLDAALVEIEGVFDGVLMRTADVESGRWDGAEVEMLVLDWAVPEAGAERLLRGSLGDFTRTGSGFRAEIAGDARALDAGGAPLCSPFCRARLGDRACGVDMAGRHVDALVVEEAAGGVRLEQMPAAVADFTFGRFRVLTGTGAGTDREITGADGDLLLLDQPLQGMVRAGDLVRLEHGCDGRFSTCCERFANGLRFCGEPHVPGTDALLRYGEL